LSYGVLQWFIYHENSMLNHEQLMDEWAKDSSLDETNLLNEMYRHPMKHSKYLTHLQTYKVKLRQMTAKYLSLRGDKVRYYNGEMSKDELNERGWKQYLFSKPLKAQMEALLEADPDLQRLQEQTLYVETLVQSCESILKDLGNRYYLFKSMVEYQKFLSGA
jgi:hypothetical protein